MRLFKTIMPVMSALLLLVSCENDKPAEDQLPPPSTGEEKVEAYKLPCDFNVMSFNVRYPAAADTGEKSWSSRKKAVYAMIKDTRPMVIGVQECYLSQRADILSNCSGYKAYGVGRDDGNTKGESMSVLYDASRVELLKSGTFWLSPTPDSPSIGWDAACNRTATWTVLKIKSTGRSIFYVNTHLDHVGTTAREEGVKLIKSRIDALNTEGLPVILTGDMNVDASDPIFDVLGMKDVREEADVTDKLYTFGSKYIDHIFYRGLEAVAYQTISGIWEGTSYLSDHKPVMAMFDFPE